MQQSKLPDKSLSYWLDSIQVPTFPELKEDIKNIDVGIIGAGITGITLAYLLSKQGLKVCLLEARNILNGTTGHTTAKITAQHGLIYDELINHFGIENTQLYYNANIEAKQFIEQTINELNIDCDYQEEDAYIFTTERNYVEKLENEYKAYEQLKIDSDIGDRSQLPFPVKKIIAMKKQAHFHPVKYLKVLLEHCVDNGVQIYENTRALTIEYNKHPTILTEDQHRIYCRFIVQASHWPFFDGIGFYPTRMYADRAYLIAAKVKKQLTEGMYINAETPTRTIRPIEINGEEMLLIGAGSHKTGQSNGPMIANYQPIQEFAQEKFQLEEVLYRWSAQDYTTLDKLPYIGRVTKEQSNVFVATGYRKWGMTNGTAAALLIHDLILDKENPYMELFSPSRTIKPDPSIKKLITYNTDVAKHLIKGKLERPKEEIDRLQKNEACVTTIAGERVGVYKDHDGKIHAVDTTCTHMGCELNWNNAENSWDCPCHGSRFTYTGEILQGPAVKPLKKIPLK